MLKVLCDKCGKDITQVQREGLNWHIGEMTPDRLHTVSYEIRDGYPRNGQPGTEEEIYAVANLSVDLIAILLGPSLCVDCIKKHGFIAEPGSPEYRQLMHSAGLGFEVIQGGKGNDKDK